MITDSLQHSHLYPLGKIREEIFRFIGTLTPETPAGKYPIQGDALFAVVDSYTTRPRDTAKLETHRKYIDIQILLDGQESIELFPAEDLETAEPYNPEKDAEFYKIPAIAPIRITLRPGRFALFFPADAHMPCLETGDGPRLVKKAVIKVAVDLLCDRQHP